MNRMTAKPPWRWLMTSPRRHLHPEVRREEQAERRRGALWDVLACLYADCWSFLPTVLKMDAGFFRVSNTFIIVHKVLERRNNVSEWKNVWIMNL